ncbi:MAG: 5-formyltetrahydrofolate cyclo-ligase [Oscillospiraceae bacterium]|nr:5-formyltetrahydrofolate cyclo-ligase [Oscillospiraceae bacterium]
MNIATQKTELRKLVAEEIAALPDDYITLSDKGILTHVLSLKEFTAAKSIMLYCSIGNEPDTLALAKAALAAGKNVAFPFCLKKGIMQAHHVRSLNELKPALLGIPAPPESSPIIERDKLDLIIVPALIFDKARYRLGYGGGYYDRYLDGINAYTVGITRHRLLRDEVPRAPHDVAVDCLVTEEQVFAQ